jgi:hypothetical protein
MPPTDRAYSLVVTGLFSLPVLSSDSSASYWSIEHPDLLIWAAHYQLEVSYRNNEGAKALYEAILKKVEEIDNEVVQQEIVERSHLGDSGRFMRPPIRNVDAYYND